jgi:2-keto-4-pentenoate hydratase/2-oxohepta-3-ene-1,7-dioic acid hydratase in catechol pathway
MRLATFRHAGGPPQLGAIVDDHVVAVSDAARAMGVGNVPDDMLSLIAAGSGPLEITREVARRAGRAETIPLSDVRLLAPITLPQRNIVCVGLNYADHVAESRSTPDDALPKHPVFFTKPPQCVIGPEETIPWHGHVSASVDWEAELAVIIGREGRDIAESEALSHVFGYTCANDVTARDLQARHQQWYKGKGLDGFCPLGPWIVTGDEIGDPQRLDIMCRVNGDEKQRANTHQMIFDVARLISAWSAGMTLLPGDILLTGTPSGVGIGRKPPEFLKPGDRVEVEIERIGTLRNVVGGAPPAK